MPTIYRIIIGGLAAVSLVACTSITVRPVDQSLGIRNVCIQENPRVQVDDFVAVLRDGFARRKIATELFSGIKPDKCEYLLTYTARHSWDIVSYLSHAELRLEREGIQIAYGEYHLIGKGGFSLMKWASAKEKMDPVIDELFKN